MKKLTLCLLVVLTNSFAARMILNENGTQDIRLLDRTDKLEFNDDWTEVIHTSEGADPDTIDLHYINRVTLDTLGGALDEFYVNTDDGTDTLDFSEIDRIFFIIGDPDTTTDSDGDGITDYDERFRYGTNPKSANTDGDLYGDYEEIYEFGTLFPLVAELPEMSVTLSTYPQVLFNYTYTTDNTTATEVVRSSSETVSNTDTYTSETTYSHEHGWEFTVGMEQTVKVGTTNQTGWGWNWSLALHGTYTKSKTSSVGSENTREYTQGVDKAESRQRSEGVQLDGAVLSADFSIQNTGEFAFDITSLTLGLVLEDQGVITSINNLTTGINDGSRVTLNPGAVAPISASRTLTVDEANGIARQIANADFLYGRIGTYSISYNDQSVNEATTQTHANCATIIVDFGPQSGMQPINKKVSALVNYNPHGALDFSPLLLKEALEAIQREYKAKTGLGKDFWWDIRTYNDSMGLHAMGVGTDSVKNDPANNAWWYIVHQREAADTVLGYTMKRNSVYPDTIPIGFQDVVHLVYSKDTDNDSVSHYEEALYGTDDEDTDSDDDGLTDYDEIRGWERVDGNDTLVFQTDPLKDDTDGDGIIDTDDADPLKRPDETLSANASLDTIYVASGAGDTLAQTTEAIIGDTIKLRLPSAHTAGTILLRTEEVVDKIDLRRLNGTWESVTKSESSELVWKSAVQMSAVSNRYQVVVTAEDCETADTTILSVYSPLPNDTRIESIAVHTDEPWKRLEALVDNGDQSDPRTTGILLMRSTSQAALESFALEDGNNDAHTVGQVYSVSGGDVVLLRDAAPSLSSESMSDGELNSGTMYHYRQYPYHTDVQARHWYAPGSAIVSQNTKKVVVCFKMHKFTVLEEADGSGAAEIAYDMQYVHDRSGTKTTSTYGEQQFPGMGDDDYRVPNHFRDFALEKGDAVNWRIKFWEDDGGPEHNDYLWGSADSYEDFGTYSREYIAARAMGGGDGWDERIDGCDYCYKGYFFRRTYYDTREAANTRVRIKLHFEASIRDY